MSGERLEILWSPVHDDKFITWGADICLYEVAPLKDIESKPSCIKLSDLTGAHLVASNGNYQYVKCIDIYPQEGSDLLLALGHSNGKVVLTTFGHTCYDDLGINGKELVPRHGRQCNAVAWNKKEANILAVALDKYRNDHCILLWDIVKASSGNDGGASPKSQHNAACAVELAKPVTELALSEVAHSVAWGHHPRTLLAGLNQKHIKVFDLRDFSNKAVVTATTKYVYEVCTDPFNEYQIASRGENIVCVWDIRNVERPLLAIQQSRNISKIVWCPNRRNLLCSLQKDSCSLKLHDIQPTPIENVSECPSPEGLEMESSLCAIERSVCPPAGHNITSFSWHPRHRTRLLAICLTGNIIEYGVCERVTVGWGAGPLVWSGALAQLHSADPVADIAQVMKSRALINYGSEPELWQNGVLAQDESLNNLWQWLSLSKNLVDEACIRGCSWKHPGVRWCLRLEPGAPAYRSEPCSALLTDLGNLHLTVYKSAERTRALQLCGWSETRVVPTPGSTANGGSNGASMRRAATLLAWQTKSRAALDLLRIVEPALALALVGYSEDKPAWRETALAAKAQTSDPYLRALLSFYIGEDVLAESGMRLEDKVGYACTFLPDHKLADYIKALTTRYVEEGILDGLLLTGTSPDGITLLQNWIERTGDVQSGSLIAAKGFSQELLKDKRVTNWIQSYRGLLMCWRAWTARCSLDASIHHIKPPHHQVFISCNFCGKTISAPQGLNRNRTTFSRIMPSSNKTKISACPNCRKPLPRCAVCLLHMGTAAGAATNATQSVGGSAAGSGLAGWFTWCQACRHGGHASHLTAWFAEHAECPVATCPCRCLSLDLPSTIK